MKETVAETFTDVVAGVTERLVRVA